MRDADSIIGVSFLGVRDPADFGQFDIAFVTFFQVLSGNAWAAVFPAPQFYVEIFALVPGVKSLSNSWQAGPREQPS